MLTEKDYCDYDTCVALRELGYKGISRFFYATKESPLRRYSYDQILTTRIADAVGHTLAISLYAAQKWLREEKGIFVYIDIPWKTDDGLGWSYFCCNRPMTEEDKEVCFASGGFYDSYEEALSEGIKEAVKILKLNNMTHEEKQIHNAVHAELREFEEFKELVKRMREAQKQWKNGDPFDGTEMELAKRMCEAEREIDEYLKKMEACD